MTAFATLLNWLGGMMSPPKGWPVKGSRTVTPSPLKSPTRIACVGTVFCIVCCLGNRNDSQARDQHRAAGDAAKGVADLGGQARLVERACVESAVLVIPEGRAVNVIGPA